jgi:hypothetical protein
VCGVIKYAPRRGGDVGVENGKNVNLFTEFFTFLPDEELVIVYIT